MTDDEQTELLSRKTTEPQVTAESRLLVALPVISTFSGKWILLDSIDGALHVTILKIELSK